LAYVLGYARDIVGVEDGQRPAGRARALSLVFFAIFLWTDPFSITAAQTALGLSSVLWVWSLWREEASRRLQLPLIGPFLLFAAVTLASVLVSDNPWRSLIGAKSLLLIVSFYLAANLVTSDHVARRLLLGFLASAAAASLLGLYQSYTRGMGYRIKGTLSIYMTLAGILMIALLLAMACLIALRGRARLVAAVSALPMVVALLLTQTRNAWLGFILGAVILTATLLRRWAPVVGAVMLAVPLVAIGFSEPLALRIKSMTNLSDATFVARIHMWRSGLLMIRDHPLLGVGVKMPEEKFSRYRVPEFPRDRVPHLHNDVLQIAAERGVIGLGAWLLLWIRFFTSLAHLRTARGPTSPFAEAVWAWSRASVAGVLLAGVFQYNFGDTEIVMVTYAAMGLPFGMFWSPPVVEPAVSKRPSPAGGVLPA
jgi:O-antigen ligase